MFLKVRMIKRYFDHFKENHFADSRVVEILSHFTQQQSNDKPAEDEWTTTRIRFAEELLFDSSSLFYLFL